MFLGLSFFSYRYFKNFQESVGKINLLKFNIPEISPELEEETEKEKRYEEFIVPSQKLKIVYPDSWQRVESSVFNLESLSTKRTEVLFYAIKTDVVEMKMGWLIVQKIDFGEGGDLKKLIEEIKSSGKERQIKVEIQNLNIEKNIAEFEIIQSQSGYSLKGREKLVLTDEGVYSIIIFSLASDWNFFQKEAEEILSSVQVLLE